MKRFGNLLSFQILFSILLFLLFENVLSADTTANTCVIQGYVRDKASRTPIQGAKVSLRNQDNPQTTDPNGFFIFVNLYKKPYWISATGTDICSPTITIDASGMDTVNVILETKPSGKIKGKILDEQNLPILNAGVSCQGEDAEHEQTYQNAKVNQQGEFTLSNLDPDMPINYLNAYAPGYKSSYKRNVQFPAGQKELNITFTLSSASQDTTNKQKTMSISGNVTDSFGKGIEGASVANGSNQWYGNYKSTTTDINGLYTLKDIPVQNYGWGITEENMVFFAKATGYSPAWKQMSSAKDTILNFTLSDAHYIGGKVVDTEGNSIPRVSVSSNVTPDMDMRYANLYTWSPSTMGDTTGNFMLTDLPSERINFSFYKDGYTPVQNTTLPMDRDDLVITLQSSGDIAGIVIDDETRKPITAFKIFLGMPKNFRGSFYGPPYEYSQKGVRFYPEDGKFTISKLGTDQSYKVIVEADGYNREEIDSVSPKMKPLKDTDKLEFRMKKAKPVNGIVMDNAIGRGIADVKVTVLVPRNQNFMTQYFNYQWDTTQNQWMRQQFTFIETTTDSNGRFQFTSLPLSQGAIAAEKKGYGRAAFPQTDFTQFVTLKLAKSASITVLLGKIDSTRDTVNFNLNKMESGGNVSYEFKSPDKEGKVVYSDLPTGNFYLNVRKNNANTSHQITLAEGQNYVLDLSAIASIKVTGKVRYKGAPTPQANINAYCEDSPRGNGSAQADKDGNYELQLTIPGKYRFNFMKPYNGPYTGGAYNPIYSMRTLSVVSGEYKLDCNLPDSVIQGLVLNPKTGKPVTQTAISTYIKKKGDEVYTRFSHTDYANPVWNPYRTVTTDNNGRFGLENLEAGEWMVVEEKESGSCATKSFQLKVNETKDNIVLMEPDFGSLVVTVLDEDSGNRVIPTEMGCADTSGFVFLPAMEKSTTQYPNPFYATKIALDSTNRTSFSSLPAGKYTLYAKTQEHPRGSIEIVIESGKKTEATIKLKKGGRLIFPLMDKNSLTEDEQVGCICKVLKAKDATPVMQDALGTYKRTYFGYNTQSQVSCFYIPVPPGDYTVELQTNYYSRKKPSYRPNPYTQTKLVKVEQDKDTPWEINLATLRKLNQ